MSHDRRCPGNLLGLPHANLENARTARPGLRAGLVAIVVGLALAGCNKLDKSVVEQMVTQSMASKGHALKSLTCPDGLDFKEQSFDCTGVDTAGKSLDFKVTVKPTSGGKADIRFTTSVDGKTFSN